MCCVLEKRRKKDKKVVQPPEISWTTALQLTLDVDMHMREESSVRGKELHGKRDLMSECPADCEASMTVLF